jgi:hypothetical protein
MKPKKTFILFSFLILQTIDAFLNSKYVFKYYHMAPLISNVFVTFAYSRHIVLCGITTAYFMLNHTRDFCLM